MQQKIIERERELRKREDENGRLSMREKIERKKERKKDEKQHLCIIKND